MKTIGQLTVSTPSDREIRMTRVFDAPSRLVYDAYTKPELLQRWLGVFGGWTLAVCDIDLRVGGKYRYVWRKGKDIEMGMGGEYLEIVPGRKVVTNEKFDDPWYEGEAIATVTFEETKGRTTLTMDVRYDSREIRDAVLRSPMETGVAASYDTLEQVLARQPTP
jgi:uncharacterized protein YndB with AHSA1/START domain